MGDRGDDAVGAVEGSAGDEPVVGDAGSGEDVFFFGAESDGLFDFLLEGSDSLLAAA